MNKENLLCMLEYASIAYKRIQPKLDKDRLIIIDDKKNDVQCCIREEKNNLNITFRGTDSFKNWITDLKFWKRSIPYNNTYSKIRVHSGFINAYKTEEVRLKIQNSIRDSTEKIRISGHSYGAALAALCAVDLEYNFPDKDYEVFLFGCPRIGNQAFKTSYEKRIFKTFRVDNGNDIVTKIPFAILGYKHVGIKIHIGAPRVLGIFSFNQHRTQDYYTGILKSKL